MSEMDGEALLSFVLDLKVFMLSFTCSAILS